MKRALNLILAVMLCLLTGCGSTEQPSIPQNEKEIVTADVIVVGGGGAGLSAAAGASESGASVIVLEAAGFTGGAAMTSGGHMAMLNEEMNAAAERNDADLQKYLDFQEKDFNEWAPSLTVLKQQVTEYLASDQKGRFDSVERMIVDHYILGQGTDIDGKEVSQDYELVKEGLENNWEIFTWLQSGGMEIKDTFYKDHANNPVDGGVGLARALKNLAENADVEIILETRAVQLIEEDGKVVGVIAQDKNGNEVEYRAEKGVVLATGSFSGNPEMCAEYQRIGTGLTANNSSNNLATNKGDGIIMAHKLGAELRDMQFMMTVLKGYQGGCTLSQAGTITGKQQLVVNQDSKRYGDESKGSFSALTNNQPNGLAFYVGDNKMIEAINDVDENYIEDKKDRGFLFLGDTLEEAAKAAGLDHEVLMETVAQFNQAVQNGKDDEFGRETFNGEVNEGPYIIAKMEMAYHLTYGGLVIDNEAHVLREDGSWISGLYAAGDVTSGFEGAAHQSGDCLSIVVYYGKVAGENAAQAK